MSPRAGGETDKVGNRFEATWATWQLLRVLRGDAHSIQVESPGELGAGAEFALTRNDGSVELHQAKRQDGPSNNWSIASLRSLKIWEHANTHVNAGRRYHFVSLLPASTLRELSTRARQSASLKAFLDDWLTKELRPEFDALSASDCLGTPENAWNVLRGSWFAAVDEETLANQNAVVAGMLLEGAGGAAAALAVWDIALNNLGVELDAANLEAILNSKYGIKPASGQRRIDLRDEIHILTEHWQDTVRRELLSPPIERNEAQTVVAQLRAPDSQQLSFVVGTAGGGKSAVLYQAVSQLQEAGVEVLALRLDRRPEFGTSAELGDQLGLQASPVAALASAAHDGRAVLVIDQLDAVSLASGRMPNSFDAVADIVREAASFPELRVVLACRQFDVDNDYRIRALRDAATAYTLAVSQLCDDEIDHAVTAMGLAAEALSDRQREVLRLPLHLVLLGSVASQPDALAFESVAHLFDAYWKRKLQMAQDRKHDVRFNEVLSRFANAISDRQRLTVSETVLDEGELAPDANVLVSEHVLVLDDGQIGFFHEAFFDYTFARQWANRGQSLVEFLCSSEQELFRRAQVRQIMHHLRQRDEPRFLAEVEATLGSPDVRLHIKQAVLSVLDAFTDPTEEELDVLLATGDSDADLSPRIWRILQARAWFLLLAARDDLTAMLNGPKAEQDTAINIIAGAASSEPDRVAQLLEPYQSHSEYPNWLRWVTRFAEVGNSRSLFDLLMAGVRAGVFGGTDDALWLACHGLGARHPAWAVGLLTVHLVESPNHFDLDSSGKVALLNRREYGASELIKAAAEGAPAEFVAALLPYMLEVMRLTSANDGPRVGLPDDKHFAYFYAEMHADYEIDDTLLTAMRAALATLVQTDPVAARPILNELARSPYAGAQSLLYRGLIAGGAASASWAARLLLENVDRLFCGTLDNSVWTTRELLLVVAPTVSAEVHQQLEDAVRDLRFDWERRHAGRYAFTLLSALDESRLSAEGRKRLGEYQRKFQVEEPSEPQGMIGGFVESPVPASAVPHMTDANWLQAMSRYDADDHDRVSMKGGAGELSSLLQQQAQADPVRFAKLGAALPADANPAYGSAILTGLGQATPVQSAEDGVVFDCVRHIADLGHAENDRWLGWALSPYAKSVSADLIELVRNRALTTEDPIDDSRRISSNSQRDPGDELRMAGMNSARGALAEALGNFLVYDEDGSRTELVSSVLDQLASDPVLSVRSQVAHVVAANLRFNRDGAVGAFRSLIETDDQLLTGPWVRKLMLHLGTSDPNLVIDVIARMLDSDLEEVRQCGGELAAYAALEWASPELLDRVLAGSDTPSRVGAAGLAAHRLAATRDAAAASAALTALFVDDEPPVRAAAAEVAGALRRQRLRPFSSLLTELIDSPAFSDATPQIFLTLEYAPDRVDDLALRCAQRFLETFGSDAGNMRTSAAGDVHYVTQLVLRGLAQSRIAAYRSSLLDVIDALVKVDAYNIEDAMERAGR